MNDVGALDGGTAQRYARLAGVLGLMSVVAGGFGEAYVPYAVVAAGDRSVTAANIAASESLLRWGFAAYLVEAICDVGLTLLFFALFRAVHKDAALVAVFFRLIGTSGFGTAHVFFFATLPTIVSGGPLDAFARDQVNAIAMLLIRLSEYGQTVFTMFYGVGTLIFGYLMYRAKFLPGFIGILVMVSAAGFIAKAFTWVLLPAYSSPLLLAPAGIAFLMVSLWLVVKGIDPHSWLDEVERLAQAGSVRP